MQILWSQNVGLQMFLNIFMLLNYSYICFVIYFILKKQKIFIPLSIWSWMIMGILYTYIFEESNNLFLVELICQWIILECFEHQAIKYMQFFWMAGSVILTDLSCYFICCKNYMIFIFYLVNINSQFIWLFLSTYKSLLGNCVIINCYLYVCRGQIIWMRYFFPITFGSKANVWFTIVFFAYFIVLLMYLLEWVKMIDLALLVDGK